MTNETPTADVIFNALRRTLIDLEKAYPGYKIVLRTPEIDIITREKGEVNESPHEL